MEGVDKFLKFTKDSVNISSYASNEYFEGTQVDTDPTVGDFIVVNDKAYKVISGVDEQENIIVSNNQDETGEKFNITTGKFMSQLIGERNKKKASELLGINYDENGKPINKELPKRGFFSKMKDGISNVKTSIKNRFGFGGVNIRTRRRKKSSKRKRPKRSSRRR